VTGRHTFVEARRNLRRLLDGADHADAVAQFTLDWRGFRVTGLDEAVCSAAAEVAEQTGARTPDALHLAAALQAGEAKLVTYDRRLGEAAERSGLTVVAP